MKDSVIWSVVLGCFSTVLYINFYKLFYLLRDLYICLFTILDSTFKGSDLGTLAEGTATSTVAVIFFISFLLAK